MAGVVKWLRPRIVVPLCVGSNPTTRPIKKTVTFVTVFFISVMRMRSHQMRSICGVRADFRTAFMPDSEEIEQTRTEGSIAKLSERGGNPRQIPPPAPFTEIAPSGAFSLGTGFSGFELKILIKM